MVCFANQLTGFFMTRTCVVNVLMCRMFSILAINLAGIYLLKFNKRNYKIGC